MNTTTKAHWSLTPADFISQGACDYCYDELDERGAVLLPGQSRAVCRSCAIGELRAAS